MLSSRKNSELERYVRDIKSALTRLQARRAVIRVPSQVGLHRSRPRSHFHPWPELFIQSGGASYFECPGEQFTLNTHQLCVMGAGVPHAETPIDKKTPYEILVALRDRDGFLLLRGRADNSRKIRSHDAMRFPSDGGAFKCLDLISAQQTLSGEPASIYVRGLVMAFLASLLDAVQVPELHEHSACSKLVNEAKKIMRVDISKPELSMSQIAIKLGCTPDHLNRVFKKETGLNPSVWLTKERIDLACDLLKQPQHRISEIAYTCGFNSATYFIRVFKAYKGNTPKDWRTTGSI